MKIKKIHVQYCTKGLRQAETERELYTVTCAIMPRILEQPTEFDKISLKISCISQA